MTATAPAEATSRPTATTDRSVWTIGRALQLTLVVALPYALGSEMAYRWFDANGLDASFFPAAGVTMAALVMLPQRWWSSVLVGAGLAEVLVNLAHGMAADSSIAYAVPNLVQPVVGALLLRPWRGRFDLARVGHFVAFVLAAVVAAPMVGGILGATVFRVVDGGDRWWSFAVEWWVGDGLGVLVVGALALSWRASTPRGAVSAGGYERALWATGAIVATFVAFRLDLFTVAYVPVALLLVIAIRAGTRDVAVVGAVVAFVAAEGTARGHRFWEAMAVSDNSGLLYLQLALALVVSSALVMSAALAEREVSTMARGRAESAQSDAVAARQRAEFLGGLAEHLGRASTTDDVHAALERCRLAHVLDDGPSNGRIDEVVDESARRMALDALARVQLLAHERAARRRAEMLEHHAARLAAAASIEDVADATVIGLAQLDPAWAAVWQLDGSTMRMLVERGRQHTDTSPYRSVPIDADLPLTEAARHGVVVSCNTRNELFLRYPSVLRNGGADTPMQSVAVVPLHAQNLHVIGALVVTSEESHWLTDERRQVLVSLADQCGLALDRAELQRHFERAAADAELLARLSDTLDRATTAEERARHVVNELVSLGVRGVALELLEDGDDAVLLAASGPAHTLVAPAQVLPLQARGRVLGRLLLSDQAGPSVAMRGLVQTIASRAAIAIDNALLYERERDISHRLQLGLLDVSFPQVDGFRIAGAYRPGTATLDVGGDWHDAFVLPSGAIALVVGDIVGHGLEAAIAMAQLRGAVRALAAVSSPSELLDRLDVFVDSLPDAEMATLVYVELDPLSGRIRYACAGHPPPLIVSATGVSRLLWGARSTPLGRHFRSRRIESIDVLGDAERLVLYTDGLVERRGERLDDGFQRLLTTTAHDVASIDFVERLCDHMLNGVPQRDDVCVLTATRLDGRSYARSLSATTGDLAALRRELKSWLAAWIHSDETQHDVLLAVSEAVSNAVEHGSAADDGGRPIVVVASMDAYEVRVTVRDHGVWREPVPSLERGRGLGIMRALMDDVVVERHDDGTVVRLARAVPG
ncbi:MAG: SpoIIE family protein phosphatase [Acidimicrobiales bacterium]